MSFEDLGECTWQDCVRCVCFSGGAYSAAVPRATSAVNLKSLRHVASRCFGTQVRNPVDSEVFEGPRCR
jgi:hypothetical protein